MTKKIVALITFVLLTSSCSIYHINSIDSGDTYYPARSADEVAYMEEIDESCQVIGTVTVNAERKQRDIDDIIIKMRREAAILGGNVLTDIQSDATGVWKRLPVQQTIGNAYVRANYTGSAAICEYTDIEPEEIEEAEEIEETEEPEETEATEKLEETED